MVESYLILLLMAIVAIGSLAYGVYVSTHVPSNKEINEYNDMPPPGLM